jgi:hypothetical protein
MSHIFRLTLVLGILGLTGCSHQPEGVATAAVAPPLKPVVALIPQARAIESTAESEGEITISGPAAIGFFPPITQKEKDEDDGGLSEGYSHLGFALEDLEQCLAPKKLALQIKITRSIVVKDGSTIHKYDFPTDWGHAIGIVLVDTGREPIVIYATAGPSSLSELAPQAAWKYFLEPNCKRYED